MSDDVLERRIGALIVRIDRTLCVGFGDCVDEAGLFALDGEGLAVFAETDVDEGETIVDVCSRCPVDALTVIDQRGAQLAP